MTATRYVVKHHELYYRRLADLMARVAALKERLPPEEYVQHETVKLAARILRAEQAEIAEDPDRPEYRLRGELKKFRRYKRGLGRYRIIFCFSKQPPLILMLYLNTEQSLRKEGARSDPYEEFKALLRQGKLSHDPSDPRNMSWVVENTA